MGKTRIATALFLTRTSSRGVEVYLVDRSPKLRFFGGYMALPGGVIELDDGDEEARLLNACAHREMFEETGVLVPEVREQMDDPDAVRRGLLDDDRGPWRAAFESSGEPRLREFCRITTPPFAPVRYATTFFHLELPEGESPDVWPGELTGGQFWDPAQALAEWKQGSVSIVPPVLFLLELLAAEQQHEGFFAAAQRETEALAAGRLHPVRFSPGVFMAALEAKTKPPATTTNSFLVGEERLFVIDPAPTDTREQNRLFERIDAAKDTGSEVAGVVLTHYHPDHVGAVPAVCERYGLSVFAHPETFERFDCGPLEQRPLVHGDELELGRAPDGSPGWKLEAVETPGHAPGHLAFVESRYRAAIVGDLLSTLSTVVIDPAEGHMGTYLESLERLADLGIGTVYPGHGPAFRDGEALVRRTLVHRQKREDKIVAALSSETQSIDVLLASVYDDVDERIHHLARKSLEAGLIKLREEGRAAETAAGWLSR